MELTVKGKNKAGKEVIHINNSIRVNIFDWQDGFYHTEIQRFDGVIWKREGSTKCIDQAEYEQLKRKVR